MRVVAHRRVVQHSRFELLDALPAWEHLEGASQQAGVGNHFHENVDEGAERPAHQDDEQPVRLGPAAREMQERERLEQEAVGEEQPDHT